MKKCRRLCGPIRLAMPAALAIRSDHPGCNVPGHPLVVVPEEQRSFQTPTDGQIKRSLSWAQAGWSRSCRACGGQRASGAPRETETFDVGAERLGDPEPVQGEQRAQRIVTR